MIIDFNDRSFGFVLLSHEVKTMPKSFDGLGNGDNDRFCRRFVERKSLEDFCYIAEGDDRFDISTVHYTNDDGKDCEYQKCDFAGTSEQFFFALTGRQPLGVHLSKALGKHKFLPCGLVEKVRMPAYKPADDELVCYDRWVLCVDRCKNGFHYDYPPFTVVEYKYDYFADEECEYEDIVLDSVFGQANFYASQNGLG